LQAAWYQSKSVQGKVFLTFLCLGTVDADEVSGIFTLKDLDTLIDICRTRSRNSCTGSEVPGPTHIPADIQQSGATEMG